MVGLEILMKFPLFQPCRIQINIGFLVHKSYFMARLMDSGFLLFTSISAVNY